MNCVIAAYHVNRVLHVNSVEDWDGPKMVWANRQSVIDSIKFNWKRLFFADAPADQTDEQMWGHILNFMRLWGLADQCDGPPAATFESYIAKTTQLMELDAMFSEGERLKHSIGIARVGWHMPTVYGDWPQWLLRILSKRMRYDPVNKQFFLKHPDEDHVTKTYFWCHGIRTSPVWSYFKAQPATTVGSLVRAGLGGRLSKTVSQMRTEAMNVQVMPVDQPAPGEAGYFDFWENDADAKGETTF
jgi:hypothetical protein